MSSHPGPFTWQQVDQTLASSMLSELSQEFGKLSQQDVQDIRYQNIGNGNAMTIPSQRLEMHHLRTEELVARYYSVYCEVWRCQQRPLSPAFLLAIPPHILRGLLSTRATVIHSEFDMEQMHTNRRDPHWLKAAMEELRRSMDRLYSKWEKIAAFDARSLDYILAAASHKPAVDIVATQIVHARTHVRTTEARLASIEAKITMSELALSATELRQRDSYRIKTIEQHLEALKVDKKHFELRRDQWQLNLNAALSRSAEIRTQPTSNSLSDEDFHQVTGSNEDAQVRTYQEQPKVSAEANYVAAIGPEREITQARERVRYFESEIAIIDTKIAAFQQSLTQAIVHGTSSLRPRDIDKVIRKLHTDRKELEFRLNDWKLNLTTALSRSAAPPKSDPLPLTADQQIVLGRGRRMNKRSKLNYRSELKGVVALQFAKNPKASDLEICRALDSDGAVELPRTWRTGENRLFELAYKDRRTRRKVEILISKVRNEMRKRGLLD